MRNPPTAEGRRAADRGEGGRPSSRRRIGCRRRLSLRRAFRRPRLARTESVGPVAFQHLIRRYGSAVRALEALPELARRAGRTPALYSLEQAYVEISVGEGIGATLLCATEPAFPEALRAIDPPPPVIWALAMRRCCIGERWRSSERGWRRRPAAASPAAWPASWARQGWRSRRPRPRRRCGRARGLAATGHGRGAGRRHRRHLSAGERRLYRQIAEQGCIVSESAPAAAGPGQDFPRRNRLISGLSLAVVVVEAS